MINRFLFLYFFTVLTMVTVSDLSAQIHSINDEAANVSSYFKEMENAIREEKYGEIHSVIIIKNSDLIYETYFDGWHRDSLQQLQSATKSIVSTLLGAAIQNDFITDVDIPISKFYTDTYENAPDERKQAITIEDLLTQRHGLEWKEFPWNDPDNTWRIILQTEGDWFKMILETPMDTIPGTQFNYSNAAPVLTTGIIQKAAGMPIDRFAEKFLFQPLEIDTVRYWPGNGGPQNNGLALIYMLPGDMAKIGQLYLQNGRWGNQQVIPEEYVEKATSPMVIGAGRNRFYSSFDYGYFWWSNPLIMNEKAPESEQPLDVYMARGAGGQNIVVWPEKKAVVVITVWNLQQSGKPLRIFNDFIVPFLEPKEN